MPGSDMLARIAIGRLPEAEHDGLAGVEVGADGAEGNRQFVEIVDLAHAERFAFEHRQDAFALQQPRRDAHAPAADADADGGQAVAVVVLAAVGSFLARDVVVEQLLPVGGEDQFLHVLVDRPDAYSPPTSAPMLVPAMQSTGMCSASISLQHADMRDAARAAAAEGQADARARVTRLARTARRFRRHGRGRHGRLWGRFLCEQGTSDERRRQQHCDPTCAQHVHPASFALGFGEV